MFDAVLGRAFLFSRHGTSFLTFPNFCAALRNSALQIFAMMMENFPMVCLVHLTGTKSLAFFFLLSMLSVNVFCVLFKIRD